MVIAEIGAIERSAIKESPRIPPYQPALQTSKSHESQKSQEMATERQRTVQSVSTSSTLKNLVQQNLAKSTTVNSSIQSAQTLMQSMDESKTARAKQAAAASAATAAKNAASSVSNSAASTANSAANTISRAPAEQFKAVMSSPATSPDPKNTSTLTNLAQQKLAATATTVPVNSSIQSTQTLIQSIDANQAARIRQDAASAAAAVTAIQRLPPVPNSAQQSHQHTILASPSSTPINAATSSLNNLVQQNMAAVVPAQAILQSTQTLMQSIDASNSPRTQQEAAAKAAAAERRAQAQAAALSLSATEQAQKQGVKPISPYGTTTGITNPNNFSPDLALHPDATSTQSQQQQQQQQLLASIGQGGIFGQALASIAGVSGVAGVAGVSGITSVARPSCDPVFGAITPIAPIAGGGVGMGSTLPSLGGGLDSFGGFGDNSSNGVGGSAGGSIGTATGTGTAVAATATGGRRVGTGLFNTRGNLQGQSVPDFTLLRQTQAQNVQQALALNQSLMLSTSGQLQPSLFLQLGIGNRLFELMMFAHRRTGSLGIFYDANTDPQEVQAIESDPTLQAAQNMSQLLVALYLEYFFALLATIRRHWEMRLGKKVSANTSAEDGADSEEKGAAERGDPNANGADLQEMSAELDYIKRNRRGQSSNPDFHYSMLLPRE